MLPPKILGSPACKRVPLALVVVILFTCTVHIAKSATTSSSASVPTSGASGATSTVPGAGGGGASTMTHMPGQNVTMMPQTPRAGSGSGGSTTMTTMPGKMPKLVVTLSKTDHCSPAYSVRRLDKFIVMFTAEHPNNTYTVMGSGAPYFMYKTHKCMLDFTHCNVKSTNKHCNTSCETMGGKYMGKLMLGAQMMLNNVMVKVVWMSVATSTMVGNRTSPMPMANMTRGVSLGMIKDLCEYPDKKGCSPELSLTPLWLTLVCLGLANMV